MVVGLCTFEIEIPGARSLKDKRRVVRSLVARVRNEFNVSIAEVDHQDTWGLATLAVACVSSDGAYAHGLLQKVMAFVESGRFDLLVLDYQTEFL